MFPKSFMNDFSKKKIMSDFSKIFLFVMFPKHFVEKMFPNPIIGNVSKISHEWFFQNLIMGDFFQNLTHFSYKRKLSPPHLRELETLREKLAYYCNQFLFVEIKRKALEVYLGGVFVWQYCVSWFNSWGKTVFILCSSFIYMHSGPLIRNAIVFRGWIFLIWLDSSLLASLD